MVANKGGSAEYIKNTAKSNVANKELLFSHESAEDWVYDAIIWGDIESDRIVATYIHAHQCKKDPWGYVIDWMLAQLATEDLPTEYKDPIALRDALKQYVSAEVDYFVTMNGGRS